MPPTKAAGSKAEAPDGVSLAAVNAIIRDEIERIEQDGTAGNNRVVVDKAARAAMQRAVNIYLLFLATCADEHRAAARRSQIQGPDVQAAFVDTGITPPLNA